MSDSNVKARSIAAVMWGATGTVGRTVLQLAAQIILARILGPEQYGLFAIGVVVVGFSNFFSDVGIAYGLIQRPEVTDDDIRFVFSWQLVLGTTVGLAVFLLAKPLSIFFHEPRLIPVIQWLSLVCWINSATAVSTNLKKRHLDYKSIHIAQLVSYFCGYLLVGIPLALAGYAVASLVSAWIVQASINLAMLFLATKHPVGLKFSHHQARSLAGYGVNVFLTNLTNWVIGNIDRVVVGRVFPGAAVGLYSTAYNFVNNPTINVIGVLQSVLFSACSKVQSEKEKLSKAFLTVIGAVSTFIIPAFVGLAVASETLLNALYGHKWEGAAPILTPLALAMPLYMILGMSTPLLWTGGRINQEFKLQIPVAILWIVCSILAASYSLQLLAWTVLFLFLIRMSLVVNAVMSLLNLNVIQILRSAVGGLCISLAVAVAVELILQILGGLLTPVPLLLAEMAAGAFVLLAMLNIWPALLPLEVKDLLRPMAGKVPARIRPVIIRMASSAGSIQ